MFTREFGKSQRVSMMRKQKLGGSNCRKWPLVPLLSYQVLEFNGLVGTEHDAVDPYESGS